MRRQITLSRLLADLDRAAVAGWWYLVAAVAMTWPIASGLASRMIPDLGDSVLNLWILGWGADHLLRALGGDFGALAGFWHANIFYPEPLALAYSEHLFAEVVQILPVYAATGNLVLCYNLLFLSTFVLSALGAYLLVRDLTGSAAAAFLAGLFYGFVPYRLSQVWHLQVLSSQWMPFALFFARRYFDRRRARWLVAATAALVAQNLSCGYYLVFFAPFVAAYVLYEVFDRGLAHDGRLWLSLGVAGTAVALATAPFLIPYVELRGLGAQPRPVSELAVFSADVFGYLAADPRLYVWGYLLRAPANGEGFVFLGFIPAALALVGLAAHAQRVRRSTAAIARPRPSERWLVHTASAIGVAAALYTVVILVAGRRVQALRAVSPFLANISYVAPAAAVAGLVLLLVSPRARAVIRGVQGSPQTFYGAALVTAVYLSFGRIVRSMGERVSNLTVYDWLYRYVPGFDGLRVPARFAMLAALFLALLAGYGAAALERDGRRGRVLLLAAFLLFLVEVAHPPLNARALAWPVKSAGALSAAMPTADAARIYQAVNALPRAAVLTEFPFGDVEDDARYMYFSTRHWRRLTNGYSGSFPASYTRRQLLFAEPWNNPEEAWRALLASGTTHAVVHDWAFTGTRGADVREWLQRHGARPVAVHQTDAIFAVR